MRHETPAFFLERACVTGMEAANRVLTARGMETWDIKSSPPPEPMAAWIESLMMKGRKNRRKRTNDECRINEYIRLIRIAFISAISLNHAQLLPHTLERFQTFIQIILRMCGGDHHADSRLALRHGWESKRHGEHTCIK